MKKHLEITIFGRVQGVCFRDSAKRTADELGIFGYAKNMPDESVYVEVEGEEERLKEFLAWCKIGPANAEVKKVDFEYADELENYESFDVLG